MALVHKVRGLIRNRTRYRATRYVPSGQARGLGRYHGDWSAYEGEGYVRVNCQAHAASKIAEVLTEAGFDVAREENALRITERT